MSHSQFHSTSGYTQACMAQSLRRAYDYWQDQPGNFNENIKLFQKIFLGYSIHK